MGERVTIQGLMPGLELELEVQDAGSKVYCLCLVSWAESRVLPRDGPRSFGFVMR